PTGAAAGAAVTGGPTTVARRRSIQKCQRPGRGHAGGDPMIALFSKTQIDTHTSRIERPKPCREAQASVIHARLRVARWMCACLLPVAAVSCAGEARVDEEAAAA